MGKTIGLIILSFFGAVIVSGLIRPLINDPVWQNFAITVFLIIWIVIVIEIWRHRQPKTYE